MYSSKKTQITTENLSVVPFTTMDPSIKFHCDPFRAFCVMLPTNRQKDRRTNASENITFFAKEVKMFYYTLFFGL